MEQDKLWTAFEQSGKVEDYLRYIGVAVQNSVAESGETPRENNNRCTDCAGKQ